jgi:catechol 2,3-dioxygenase-like lactoylglutathione lyase family enzyme
MQIGCLTMNPALPGVVRQIGYVVDDLDGSLDRWLQLGVGPWFVMRGIGQTVCYRGQPCTVTVSLALANTGDLQVEVIQQTCATPSVFTEFLAATGGGFHQLAYWAEDFDAAMARLELAGWPKVWSGGDAEGVRFAYFEPPIGATVVEITELTDVMAGMADFVRRAALEWNGDDPIRELG